MLTLLVVILITSRYCNSLFILINRTNKDPVIADITLNKWRTCKAGSQKPLPSCKSIQTPTSTKGHLQQAVTDEAEEGVFLAGYPLSSLTMVITEVTVWMQLSADRKMQEKATSFPVVLFFFNINMYQYSCAKVHSEGIKDEVPIENLPKSSY